MKKTKVMTMVGTRPEIIRLSRVMAKLDAYVDHVLVHTGQNYDYELNKIFFEDLELRKPDYFLDAAGESAMQTIGTIIEKTDKLLSEVKPDALLVLGDTNSCLAALPAKRKKIPVFHMEAGNRCFDQRVPEEINRKIVDHISDINMPYSSIAREYLLREGLPADRIIKTGSPMYEVIHHYMPKIQASKALEKNGVKAGEYFLVSCHREENVDFEYQIKKFAESLNAIADAYKIPVIVSTHPRTRKRLEQYNIKLNDLIQTQKPMAFSEYVNLQMHAKLVLSDSGTITEESSILNFPALNIREAHERPEGMEEASVIMTGLDPERILESATIAMQQPRGQERAFREVSDYTMPNVSEKVVRIIVSYIDYVNRNVWKK
ncbi:non-hydrolyzing UDP-N-acetylglucosamine 2-epimerase [Gracilinema caldarium]|uniref:UDP-N-acetylglucosamine 2-epimerase n=1 Tax=Gracilinema caldarium (strain ATCC 51460 / DSM 7334 / H1) TaxID=744872 RepID=F8F035_GRAC1|nr:UDP-N-acetylglucosamine 2-epimerase (non-hydrolyzing) [Gracilinema caldarium]AEJ18688.1 UDP-N-acetylglucosamine 2-epimerase [Gracilinema caldarium DSM 7334]